MLSLALSKIISIVTHNAQKIFNKKEKQHYKHSLLKTIRERYYECFNLNCREKINKLVINQRKNITRLTTYNR